MTVAPVLKLPPYVTGLLSGALMALAESREPDFIVGGAERPYLLRWHLAPRGEGPGCYLHQFCRSDDDRALHDHPYASTSIILRGRYVEHMPKDSVLREAGDVVHRPDAAAPHRVELLERSGVPQPAWTLFLTGPRERDWGFHCPQGWVRWQDFVDARDAGGIGPGCG